MKKSNNIEQPLKTHTNEITKKDQTKATDTVYNKEKNITSKEKSEKPDIRINVSEKKNIIDLKEKISDKSLRHKDNKPTDTEKANNKHNENKIPLKSPKKEEKMKSLTSNKETEKESEVKDKETIKVKSENVEKKNIEEKTNEKGKNENKIMEEFKIPKLEITTEENIKMESETMKKAYKKMNVQETDTPDISMNTEHEKEETDSSIFFSDSETETENEIECQMKNDVDGEKEKIETSKKKKRNDNASKESTSIYENILSKLHLEKNEELEDSHIIILGAKDAGKSCLVQALQKISSAKESSNDYLYKTINGVLPLDYACLNVINFEENTKIKDVKGNSHVWLVQHSSYVSSLVKHIKNFKNAKRVVILVCTDLYKPYNIISDLNHWIESLYTFLEEFHSDWDLEVYNELKEKLENYVYNYKQKTIQEKIKENNVNKVNNLIANNKNSTNYEENKNELDKKKLIKVNLAYPIFFIICKSDGYEILNNRTYQGYIDVIISYLRNLAINYHASIIFCNTANKKEPKNIFLLYKYIMHRLYDFPFTENAIVNNYEKIFIPSGYDNIDLINEAIQNTFAGNFNKPYDSIIVKPVTNKNIVEHSHNIVNDVHFNDFLASLRQEMYNDDEGSVHENGEVTERKNNVTNEQLLNIRNGQKDDGFEKIKTKTTLVAGTLPKENSATINVDLNNTLANNINNNIISGNVKENQNMNTLNIDNGDQSLHSFFQNLLAKGRSKSQSAQNIPTPLEKKN